MPDIILFHLNKSSILGQHILTYNHSSFMNLMPPGGDKHLLQFNHQLKVKKVELQTMTPLNKRQFTEFMYSIYAQCQLHVLLVVSYLFVSFLFPM